MVFWDGRSRVLKDLSPRWMATSIGLSQRSLAAIVVDLGDCAGRFYVPSPTATNNCGQSPAQTPSQPNKIPALFSRKSLVLEINFPENF